MDELYLSVEFINFEKKGTIINTYFNDNVLSIFCYFYFILQQLLISLDYI